MSEVIKEIQDIANECGVSFEILDEYYEDATIKTYVFEYMRFLDVNECLKNVKYHIETWRVKQELKSREKDLRQAVDEVEDLRKVKANLILTLTKKDEEKEEKLNRDNISLNLMNNLNETCIDQGKTIRSLRSQLGHAKRKLKKVEK